MPIPAEMLMAYADGELPPDEAALVEAALADDEGLRAELQTLVRTATLSRAAFDDVLREPVPPHLIAALRQPPPAVTAWRARLLPRSGPALALAASLAGLAAGLALAMLLNGPGASVGESRLADARLEGMAVARALDRGPSGTAVAFAGGTIKPTTTYPRRGGGWCREYEIARRDAAVAGIACRQGADAWRIEAEAPVEKGAGPGQVNRPASGPTAVEAAAERLQGGTPLTPAAEADEIARGWLAN